MDEVQLDHRLTVLEETMRAGFEAVAVELRTASIELKGVKLETAKQNGRLSTLEEKARTMELDATYVRGVQAGRAGITKTQLALIATAGPVVVTLVQIALYIWGGGV